MAKSKNAPKVKKDRKVVRKPKQIESSASIRRPGRTTYTNIVEPVKKRKK